MAQDPPSKTVISSEELEALDLRSDAAAVRWLRSRTRIWELFGVGAVLGWFLWQGAEVWVVLILAFVLGVPIGIREALAWTQRKALEERAARLEAKEKVVLRDAS